MAEIFQPVDVRIDNESQLMLRELRGGEWVRALKLRRAAGLKENRQVFYRMEKYLIPGGLVEERERENSDDIRLFRLTSAGTEWVADHAKELETPTTREQVQEYALEGYKAGTSAKESVQNYRKQVHRMKRRVERAEENVDEIDDAQEANDRNVEYLRERTQAVRQRSIGNRNRLESVEEDVEERATIDAVDAVRDSVSDVERRLTVVEDKQTGLVRQQAEAERERAHLRRLAKPAGYLVVGALAAYVVVLVAAFLIVPELLASVLIGGIGGLLGVAVGTGVVVSGFTYSVGR